MLSACASSAYVPSTDPEDADLSGYNPAAITGRGFTVGPDVRVFALFAFLNTVGGYDSEFGESMDPLRVSLRDDVNAALHAVEPGRVARWKAFYASHRAHPWAYLAYTLTLGSPPRFEHVLPGSEVIDADTVARLSGFREVLADFYGAAELEALYREKYAASVAQQAAQYSGSLIDSDISAVYTYLRFPGEMRDGITVSIVPNPFDSHYDAFAVPYATRLAIINGPGSSDLGLNIHESLHKLVNPVVESLLPPSLPAVRRVYDANRDKPAVRNSYASVDTFANECMVRALDYRILRIVRAGRNPDIDAIVRANMDQDALGGLALVSYFYDRLSSYEQDSSMSFDSFVKGALAGIGAKQG
jgi:hypothetical protein